MIAGEGKARQSRRNPPPRSGGGGPRSGGGGAIGNSRIVDFLAGGDPILAGHGWGFGMTVMTAPDDVSPVPGRYGWNGGYGTFWFNDPTRNLVAIAMTQTSDFLFNGAMTEFAKLAVNS